jgi:hypothetical protein
MTSFSPAPMQIAEVLNPRWLETVLYKEFPGVQVTGSEILELQFNSATKTRIAVKVENAPLELTKNICVKGMHNAAGQLYVASGVSKTEALFYQDLAVPLSKSFNLPRCIYTAIDPDTGHGLVVMEDLVVGGCKFLSALTPYTADEASTSLDQLARLHAAGPEGSALFQTPWLVRSLDKMAETSLIPIDMLNDLLHGPRGEPLPAYVLDGPRLHSSLGKLAERFGKEPSSLVHGDAHAGNLYKLPNGKDIGLIDWQLIQRGYWALDVAYHLGAALTPEDRRANERDLLGHYLDRRAAHGATKIDKDVAWEHYRMAMLYGYYLWGVTRRVDPVIIVEFVRRLGLAVHELESFKLAEA